MAKISELVKTYRLLSDPNAPDWNIKFIGGIVVAFAIVAAATAIAWNATRGEDGLAQQPAAAAATSEQAQPGDLSSCDATEVAQELARLGTTSLPRGHALPSGCRIA